MPCMRTHHDQIAAFFAGHLKDRIPGFASLHGVIDVGDACIGGGRADIGDALADGLCSILYARIPHAAIARLGQLRQDDEQTGDCGMTGASQLDGGSGGVS